jgi:patatin-like phospholipase/acyl hydrolase
MVFFVLEVQDTQHLCGTTSMKKILSVDGGGIRGLIPAMILTEIEKRTRRLIRRLPGLSLLL